MAGPITIAIIGDNRRLDSALATSEGRLSRFGSVAGRVGRAAALGLAAVGVGAVVAGAKLFQLGDEANDSNDRIKSIAGSMKLFGAETDAVTGRLIKLAETTAINTGVDANSIKATQAKLLTFRDLAKSADVVGGAFDRATQASVDMAAAGFGSAETNAVMLGKALQDPGKQLAALGKTGALTKDQIEAIGTEFERTGNLSKAQGSILGAVETQVGGTAEAMAGGWDRLKMTGIQFATSLGQKLAPQIDRFAGLLVDRALPAAQRLAPVVADLARQAADALAPALQRVGAFVAAAVPVWLRFAGSMVTLYGAIATNVFPILQSVGTYLAGTFGPIFTQVGGIITGQLIPAVQAIAGFVGSQLLPVIASTATQIGQNLRPIFDQLATTLQGTVLPAVTQGGNKLQEWWPTIQRVIVVVAKLVGGALVFASAILGKVLPVAIRFSAFMVGNLAGAIVGVVKGLANVVGAVIGAGKAFVNGVQDVARFAEGVRQKIGNAIDAVEKIPGKIKTAIGDAGTLLLQIGKDIIGGLKAGIDAAAHLVADAVKAIIDKIPGPVKKIMGIASPSKVMADIGKWIPAGLVVGIHSGAPGVADAMGHLGELIADAFQKKFDKKIDPSRLRKIMRGFEDEAKRLRGLAKQYSDLAGRLAGARDLAASVAASARGFADITSVGVNDDGTQTAASITQGLNDRLAAIQQFTANIDALRKAGLNKETIDQIIAKGVEQGSVTAAALVAGGPQAIQTVNGLQSQIGAASAQLGNVAAVNMYGAAGQAADGFIAGLEADMEKLDKAASRIARKLVQAIKRELGIKSPSRVARGLARSFNDGLILQTYVDGSRVKKAGAFTAKQLTDGFARPQLTADARANGVAARGKMQADVKLSADALTELELGRKVSVALDAWGGITA